MRKQWNTEQCDHVLGLVLYSAKKHLEDLEDEIRLESLELAEAYAEWVRLESESTDAVACYMADEYLDFVEKRIEMLEGEIKLQRQRISALRTTLLLYE